MAENAPKAPEAVVPPMPDADAVPPVEDTVAAAPEEKAGEDLLDNLFGDNSDILNADQKAALEFDPFADKPPETPVKEPDKDDASPDVIIGGDPDAQLKTAGSPAPAPAEGEPVVPVEGAPAESAEAAAVKAELALLKKTMADAAAAPLAVVPAAVIAPPTAIPASDPAVPPPPSFAVQMPTELMQLLDSEDAMQRSQGYTQLVNGVGQMVYGTVEKMVNERLATAISQVETRTSETATRTAAEAELEKDFYDTFPQLNQKALRGFVSQVSVQLQAETGAKEWTEELRNAIGMRATQLLQAAAGVTGAGGNGVDSPPSIPPVKQPPTQIKGGARPAAPSTTKGEGFIADTLFG